MQFTKEMIDTQSQLKSLGHEAIVTSFADGYINLNQQELEQQVLKDKYENDAMKEYFNQIKDCDAILVLNYDKKGITNYIGGNTFLEIGYAHILDKKIFLLNPIPSIPFYESEIVATNPIILNGDLSLIK